MLAYVTEPVVVLPANKVTTAEISADIQDRHRDHPRLPVLRRVVEGCGVESRYFTRPFAEVVAVTDVAHRTSAAFEDARVMAAEAARKTMRHNGITAGEVDAVITSHTTGWALPNLDVHLVADLGLRPDVSRIALTASACAGAAQALARAADLCRARPAATVLVVVSEVLSAIYHRDEDTVESMIYKALFGDSAGACIVSGRPLGPGFAIESTVEYVLPDSLDRYRGHLDATGFHFTSTKQALTAPRDALPHVLTWLDTWHPSFGIIHPGGPRIIADTAAAVGVDPHHSLASLSENGNLGGNAVLDVLRRTHSSPPRRGEHGVLLAFGPGFTVAGARGIWH